MRFSPGLFRSFVVRIQDEGQDVSPSFFARFFLFRNGSGREHVSRSDFSMVCHRELSVFHFFIQEHARTLCFNFPFMVVWGYGGDGMEEFFSPFALYGSGVPDFELIVTFLGYVSSD